MRFKTYSVRLQSGEEYYRTFDPLDYRTMGVPFSPASGMPQLEAYQFVNEMNRGSIGVVYFLRNGDKA